MKATFVLSRTRLEKFDLSFSSSLLMSILSETLFYKKQIFEAFYLLFLNLWMPDHVRVVYFTLLISRNIIIFSHASLLQKGALKKFHSSIFSHAHPCMKSSHNLPLLQTEPNTELLLLAPLLSLVIKVVSPHCPASLQPRSAGMSLGLHSAGEDQVT